MMASEGDRKLGINKIFDYLAQIDNHTILRGHIAELLRNLYISRPRASKHAYIPFLALREGLKASRTHRAIGYWLPSAICPRLSTIF
jgi:hypothetical protein